MTTRMSLAVLWALAAALTACKHPDIGKPCEDEKDCAEELICDVHDGKGTCQDAHGHEAGEEETTAGMSGSSGEATTGATTTTMSGSSGEATTGATTTGMSGSSGEATTHAH